MSGMAGSVFLGLAGIGLGALIIDYAVSESGESWVDEIGAKLRHVHPRATANAAARSDASTTHPNASPRHPVDSMWIGPITVTRPGVPGATAMPKPELLARLGGALGFVIPSAISAADVSSLVARFQSMAGLPVTGALDPSTTMRLRQGPTHLAGWRYLVGAEAWEGETASLGPEAQDVIRHAIAQEKNSRTLSSLALALQAAGYPQAAAAVKVKTPGAQTAASGWWP